MACQGMGLEESRAEECIFNDESTDRPPMCYRHSLSRSLSVSLSPVIFSIFPPPYLTPSLGPVPFSKLRGKEQHSSVCSCLSSIFLMVGFLLLLTMSVLTSMCHHLTRTVARIEAAAL